MDLYGDMKNGRLPTIPNFISVYSPSKSRTGTLPVSEGCIFIKKEPDMTIHYIMRGVFSQSFSAGISHFLLGTLSFYLIMSADYDPTVKAPGVVTLRALFDELWKVLSDQFRCHPEQYIAVYVVGSIQMIQDAVFFKADTVIKYGFSVFRTVADKEMIVVFHTVFCKYSPTSLYYFTKELR